MRNLGRLISLPLRRRPSLDASRERARRHLREVIAEIRIVNPAASEAAEALAGLMVGLLTASEREARELARLLGVESK
ncbi:MAG: hypothetical protein QI223_00840 [Candidatus Korarchaeota archaeon]|nr:hypothetical protein [Candidatus Korarchaeota archaeon]